MQTIARRTAAVTQPRQNRAVATRERLLDVAGALLADVGVERISTNLICAGAGMTPPALYRYFKDKYAVLEALGERLMDRQNAALFDWLDRCAPGGLEGLAAGVEDLLRATAEVTAAEPGAIWTLRESPHIAWSPTGWRLCTRHCFPRWSRRSCGAACASASSSGSPPTRC
jgi:AcrR family transcriptional regulator